MTAMQQYPKNMLALLMVMKWDGTCICQDVTFSQASQYWQPQLVSSILTTPNTLSSQQYDSFFCYRYGLTLLFFFKKWTNERANIIDVMQSA